MMKETKYVIDKLVKQMAIDVEQYQNQDETIWKNNNLHNKDKEDEDKIDKIDWCNFVQLYVSLAMNYCDEFWKEPVVSNFKASKNWYQHSLNQCQNKMNRMVILNVVEYLQRNEQKHLQSMKPKDRH